METMNKLELKHLAYVRGSNSAHKAHMEMKKIKESSTTKPTSPVSDEEIEKVISVINSVYEDLVSGDTYPIDEWSPVAKNLKQAIKALRDLPKSQERESKKVFYCSDSGNGGDQCQTQCSTCRQFQDKGDSEADASQKDDNLLKFLVWYQGRSEDYRNNTLLIDVVKEFNHPPTQK